MAKRRHPAAQPAAAEPAEAEEELDLSVAAGEDGEAGSDSEDSPVVTSEEEGLSDEEDASASEDDSEEEEEGSGEGSGEERGSDDEELDRAIVDVLSGGAKAQPGGGGEPRTADGDAAAPALAGTAEDDPATDSSEDEREPRNTVGDVPLEWYKDEEHIGYDRAGARLLRAAPARDALDVLLEKNDLGQAWRTIRDEYNGEEIVLSKEEIEMLQRIRQGRFPHVEVNPYEPEADWFSSQTEVHPLSTAPQPKRRFMPSKWEEKKIVKLVRALRKGWIKREQEAPKEPEVYLLWADDGNAMHRSAAGLQYLPAPKPSLPGHEESYNPPKEYLPSEEERNAYALLDDEDKPSYVPQAFASLRKVPAYERFIRERFERCLDLYLCPRKRRKRPFVKDARSLVPQLPKPADLQPFPQQLLRQFLGHTGAVRSISVDAGGQWLASGSDDGRVRVWEVATGRCMRSWDLGSPVKCVAWCPKPGLCLLAAAAASRVLLLSPGLGPEEAEEATAAALALEGGVAAADKPLCRWEPAADCGGALQLSHNFPVRHVAWHGRGDYFASVAPTGNTQAVLVHQLSKRASQAPFKRARGRVAQVAFHPGKPFFFVATLNRIYVYNLAKQALAKTLRAGQSSSTSFALHPSGDHLIVGKEDNRLIWFDLDLSNKPYKVMRYHEKPLEAVAFHRCHPLFASASDDGTVHVFHGMVYQDLLTNPLIVPVKILRGHRVVAHQGVLDCAFHPTQPWLFSAGGDAAISLFTN